MKESWNSHYVRKSCYYTAHVPILSHGTHVPILAPTENHADYVNRKGYHSVVMQAVVDSKYLFRDIVIGWPGSVHDARVLSNSKIFNIGEQNKLLPADFCVKIGGKQIAPVILGDPAYPLLPWLLKPYPENANTIQQHRRFNYRLSRARVTVENVLHSAWHSRSTFLLARVSWYYRFKKSLSTARLTRNRTPRCSN